MASPSGPTADNPGVKFPPPFIFLIGFILGWLLDWRVHAIAVPGLGGWTDAAVSIVLVVAGLALAGSGIVTFLRASTAIVPHHAASRIVTNGPYRFTRNPMYSGLTLVYAGSAVAIGSLWPLILLPVVLLVLTRFVIRREERYLSAAFGRDYEEYRARVGRWM